MQKGELSIKERILNFFLQRKLLTQKDLENAINLQKKKGGRLSDILIGMGLVSRDDLTLALSQELGMPPIDLTRIKISPDIIKIIPKKIAKQYGIIPVSKMGNILTVAIADPLNVLALDDLKSITKMDIGPVITNEKDINEAIREYYEQSANDAIDQVVEDIKGADDINIIDNQGESEYTQAELLKLTQEAPVVKITNLLLAEAVKLRASDILIEPLENELRVRYRVDGILAEGRKPPKRLHQALISRLKVMSDLNIAERRLPQDGRFKIKIQNREIDFRISVLPSNIGEKAALRVLDKSQATLDLDKLGFEKQPLDDLKEAALRPHGMILVCGPTGCGKTTSLYSTLKFIDAPEKNIITIEDPVEYELPGINQVSSRPDIGLTFASALRSILRQDPDIIMVGEIRDFETVDVAIKSSLTGHLVLSTLHTTSASGSIVRLINMGVEPFLITSSILLFAAQRLIRKICPACKTEIKLTDEVRKKFKISDKAGPHMYRGEGCKDCNKTGYKGRIGLIETLILSPEIKKLILEKSPESKIMEQARKEGMKTLRENGISKVLNGQTTLDEIVRVTVGDQDL